MIVNLLPNADAERERRSRDERRIVPNVDPAQGTIGNTFHEGGHKEVFNLVRAEPVIARVHAEDENESPHHAIRLSAAEPQSSVSSAPMRSSARSSSLLCAGAFTQLLAPDGCGSGITRERPPACSTSCTRPMIRSSGADGRNFSIASFPTGIKSAGRMMRSSDSSHVLHCSCSKREGTRSPRPDGCGPG